MTMHWFLFFFLPLSPSSAECIDRAAWRNPLSRHFSFPLTDRLWRARAFGPPAWLAARQLNKPSSCYNSLKHFQLPESNKSCRRALRCFSTSNPTPQRVLPRLSFGLSGDPPCYDEEEFKEFFWTKKAWSWRGKLAGAHREYWEEEDGFKDFSQCFSTVFSADLLLHHLLASEIFCAFVTVIIWQYQNSLSIKFWPTSWRLLWKADNNQGGQFPQINEIPQK